MDLFDLGNVPAGAGVLFGIKPAVAGRLLFCAYAGRLFKNLEHSPCYG